MKSTHNLSNNLISYRKLRRMSQSAFAHELGISKSTLQEIEHGKNPNLETLSCISEHLGVSPSVLLSDSIPPTQLGIITHMVQGFDWFARLSPEEQDEFLNLILQISRSFAVIKENRRDME